MFTPLELSKAPSKSTTGTRSAGKQSAKCSQKTGTPGQPAPMNDPKIVLKKEADDPICPRISAGGKEGIGFYIVYRGDLEEIKRMFKLLNDYIQTQ